VKTANVYFPSLNGVRFFAAFIVIIDHLELFKIYFGIKPLWSEQFSSYLGSFGVTIFFVLSGFLITYLLLVEKENSEINLKKFYLRRILRIWPLYYLLLTISFFVIPHMSFFYVPQYSQEINLYFPIQLILYSFLLANVAFVYLPNIAFGNVLWSVAVEEQFYIVWPLIIKNKKNLIKFFCLLLVGLVFIRLFINLNPFSIQNFFPNKLYTFLDRTRFSCMIIGGIGAYYIKNENDRFMKVVYSKHTQIFAFLLFILLLINVIKIPGISLVLNEVISLISMIIIVNLATNKNSMLSLENKVFNYLGKISYGMYIYHLFVITLTLKIFNLYSPKTDLQFYIWSALLLITVLIFTIAISNISFIFFESWFLNLKKNSQSVVTSNTNQNTN